MWRWLSPIPPPEAAAGSPSPRDAGGCITSPLLVSTLTSGIDAPPFLCPPPCTFRGAWGSSYLNLNARECCQHGPPWDTAAVHHRLRSGRLWGMCPGVRPEFRGRGGSVVPETGHREILNQPRHTLKRKSALEVLTDLIVAIAAPRTIHHSVSVSRASCPDLWSLPLSPHQASRPALRPVGSPGLPRPSVLLGPGSPVCAPRAPLFSGGHQSPENRQDKPVGGAQSCPKGHRRTDEPSPGSRRRSHDTPMPPVISPSLTHGAPTAAPGGKPHRALRSASEREPAWMCVCACRSSAHKHGALSPTYPFSCRWVSSPPHEERAVWTPRERAAPHTREGLRSANRALGLLDVIARFINKIIVPVPQETDCLRKVCRKSSPIREQLKGLWLPSRQRDGDSNSGPCEEPADPQEGRHRSACSCRPGAGVQGTHSS